MGKFFEGGRQWGKVLRDCGILHGHKRVGGLFTGTLFENRLLSVIRKSKICAKRIQKNSDANQINYIKKKPNPIHFHSTCLFQRWILAKQVKRVFDFQVSSGTKLLKRKQSRQSLSRNQLSKKIYLKLKKKFMSPLKLQ